MPNNAPFNLNQTLYSIPSFDSSTPKNTRMVNPMGAPTQTNSSPPKSQTPKKNKGGRPKTPWTPSLKRKLVRLYTLTSLSKLEISKAIRQDGFAPSESDIQKKLRLLLPTSYAKDHRSFRPINEDNMLKRFSTLQICNRKQKREKLRARTRRGATTNTFSRNAITKRDEQYMEGHPAFRNYANSSTTEEVIRPSQIQHATKTTATQENTEIKQQQLGEVYSSPEQKVPTTLPLRFPKLLTPPVCQIANPCLVMLDGSYIVKGSNVDKNESEKTKSIPPQSPVFQTPDVIAKPVFKAEPPAVAKTALATVGSLQGKINGKHTKSYLEHVSSVINYSVPSSKNSSVMSWTSRISSFGSRVGNSKSNRGEESNHDRVRSGYSMNTSPRPIPIPTQGEDNAKGWAFRQSTPNKSILSTGEEDIWNEFIDVSHVSDPGTVSSASRGSFYSPFSILSRKCCKSPRGDAVESHTPTCKLCGTTNTHRLLAVGISKVTHIASFLKEASVLLHSKDYYGNTPLHAASAHGNIRVLNDFVENWQNIPDSYEIASQTNTSGENFLHAIQLSGLADFLLYCEVIKMLKRECPGEGLLFSKRDFRGRTILHSLMQTIPEELFSDDLVEQLCTVFSQTGILSHAADNQGNTLQKIIENRIFFATSHHLSCRKIISKLKLGGGSESNRVPYLSYKILLSNSPATYKITNFPPQIQTQILKDINWVDSEGDTLLISIISHPLHTSEPRLQTYISSLLTLGADIHSRDRNGNTPLCFAVKRGFRSISKLLLEAGANPRCYNYAGVDILSRATQWMNASTTDENTELLHSSIYTCILLLIDYGAKLDPSGLDEWMTPLGKKEFGRAMKVKSDAKNKNKNLKGILKNRRVEALGGGRGTVFSEKEGKREGGGIEGWTLLNDAPQDWTLNMSFRVW